MGRVRVAKFRSDRQVSEGSFRMTIRREMRVFPAGLFAVATLLVASGAALAQQGNRDCPMMGMMGGRMGMQGGMGMGMMGRMGMMNDGMMGGGMADMGTIHSLFAQSGTISRTVKMLPNGIEALTESSDPQTVGLLQEHVAAMKTRLEKNQPIRQGDPLFAALFQHADKIVISVTATKRGVKVVETSTDAYTVRLLQSHAQAISDFIKNGMAGMHTFHPIPPRQ